MVEMYLMYNKNDFLRILIAMTHPALFNRGKHD